MKFRTPSFKHLLLSFALTIVAAISFAQNKNLLLTKQQALEDLNWLKFSLEYVHPRLYKYDDKKTVDARFDSFRKALRDQISAIDFLAQVSKINAGVRCGHLYTIPQEDLNKQLAVRKVLPFYIKIVDKKLFLFNDCSAASITSGSRILSINGKSDSVILNAMLKGIPADGYIETRKIKLLERYFNYSFQGFDLYYYLFADRGQRFKIDFLAYGTTQKKTVTVDGLSIEERQKTSLKKYAFDERSWFQTPSPAFEINTQNKYALLKVPRSFYDKKFDPDFDSLLSSAFRKIKESKIQHLILDMRNNEGGNEHQQIELMSYLYNKPFKLYQNIYLSHLDYRPLKSVIVERDSSDLLFNNDDEYMRKINENLWINNYDYSDNLQFKQPKADVFTGKLYVLMNGACFSSAADLISDLKKTTDAVFIGEESGGTFEGPTGGGNIVIQLPNSKIMVRISPNLQIGYLYQKHPIGRGVSPTHEIKYDTVEPLLKSQDLEMELAQRLIQYSKNE